MQDMLAQDKKGRVTSIGYISKEDLCGALTVLLNLYKRNQRPGWGAIEGLIDLIEQTPDAEVAPKKHGEWLPKNMDASCTVCGGGMPRCPDGSYYESDFCPNCGADMRKDGWQLWRKQSTR